MEFPESIFGQKELEGMISSFTCEKVIIFKAIITHFAIAPIELSVT